MTEPPADKSKRLEAKSRNSRLLVGTVIVLVILLVIASSAAVYYASSSKPSPSDSSIMKSLVLDNQSVVGASGGPSYVFAGTFTAPQPGYLVVTGTSFPVNYSIALEIVMNASKPDNYILQSNGINVPYYNIRPDSANSTLITTPFKNDYALLPVLRGNVSIYVYTPGYNVGAVLNAMYYY